jgi:hypothetical protein
MMGQEEEEDSVEGEGEGEGGRRGEPHPNNLVGNLERSLTD